MVERPKFTLIRGEGRDAGIIKGVMGRRGSITHPRTEGEVHVRLVEESGTISFPRTPVRRIGEEDDGYPD